MHCSLLYAHFSNETGKQERVVLDEIATACSSDSGLLALGLQEAHSHCVQFHLTESNRDFLLTNPEYTNRHGENWAIHGGGGVIKTCGSHFTWRNGRRPDNPLTFKGKYGITLQQMERFVRVCERVGLLLLATEYFRPDTVPVREYKGQKVFVNYVTACRRGLVGK